MTDQDNLPSRRQLAAELDGIALPADAKMLMAKLLDTTAEVAGRIIEVGRSIIAFVMDLAKRFPATTFGAVVSLTVTFLVSSIPLLGLVLGPLVGPLLAAFMITNGALADMRNPTIEKQVTAFGAKLDAVMTHG